MPPCVVLGSAELQMPAEIGERRSDLYRAPQQVDATEPKCTHLPCPEPRVGGEADQGGVHLGSGGIGQGGHLFRTQEQLLTRH